MNQRQAIQYETAEAIATITVTRPEKLNALNRATLTDLSEAVRRAGSDEAVRGVVITGAGAKAFVAGADISELSALSPMQAVELSRQGQRVFREIELLRKPVIAAINGFALGGGCELALACHLRVASEHARIGLPEVSLGLIPGYGGTVRLPRLIGRGRALEMILSGAQIDAAEAHRIGLVNRVVPQDLLLEEARAMLERMLANGPVALAMALESVGCASDAGAEEGYSLEAHLFGLLAATDDMREGTRAFLEKRAARFEGR
jgi:enoyl-CoA hydratase